MELPCHSPSAQPLNTCCCPAAALQAGSARAEPEVTSDKMLNLVNGLRHHQLQLGPLGPVTAQRCIIPAVLAQLPEDLPLPTRDPQYWRARTHDCLKQVIQQEKQHLRDARCEEPQQGTILQQVLGPGIKSIRGEAAKLCIDRHLGGLLSGQPLAAVDVRMLVVELRRALGNHVQLQLHLWDPLQDPNSPSFTAGCTRGTGAAGAQRRLVEVQVARVWRMWLRTWQGRGVALGGSGKLDDFVGVEAVAVE